MQCGRLITWWGARGVQRGALSRRTARSCARTTAGALRATAPARASRRRPISGRRRPRSPARARAPWCTPRRRGPCALMLCRSVTCCRLHSLLVLGPAYCGTITDACPTSVPRGAFFLGQTAQCATTCRAGADRLGWEAGPDGPACPPAAHRSLCRRGLRTECCAASRPVPAARARAQVRPDGLLWVWAEGGPAAAAEAAATPAVAVKELDDPDAKPVPVRLVHARRPVRARRSACPAACICYHQGRRPGAGPYWLRVAAAWHAMCALPQRASLV